MPRPSSLVLLALVAAPALAGAPPRVIVPEGTSVRLFDVGPKDAWYRQRGNLSDLECRVGPGPMRPARATWFKGRVTCDDGRGYVFRQVTFESMSTLGPNAEGCPVGSWIGGNLPDGARVRILGTSPSDAYYGDTTLLGRAGTVAYGEMYPMRGPRSCWLGGSIMLDDPSGWPLEYYFYEVAVALESKGTGPYDGGYGGEGYDYGYDYGGYAEPACPPDAYTGSSLPDGARVIISDIHPEDAYYSTRYDLIGDAGTVDGDLHNNSGTCWFGGGMIGDDGTSYYFYKAAVTVTDDGAPTCADGVATAATIPKGNRVKIVDIHPEDAYFSTRYSVIGHTGEVTEQLDLMDGCWYAGPIRSDDGDDWYFFKAQLVDLGTAN